MNTLNIFSKDIYKVISLKLHRIWPKNFGQKVQNQNVISDLVRVSFTYTVLKCTFLKLDWLLKIPAQNLSLRFLASIVILLRHVISTVIWQQRGHCIQYLNIKLRSLTSQTAMKSQHNKTGTLSVWQMFSSWHELLSQICLAKKLNEIINGYMNKYKNYVAPYFEMRTDCLGALKISIQIVLIVCPH